LKEKRKKKKKEKKKKEQKKSKETCLRESHFDNDPVVAEESSRVIHVPLFLACFYPHAVIIKDLLCLCVQVVYVDFRDARRCIHVF